MPYAVISGRNKQYTVRAGERVRLDKRADKPGDKVTFDQVLFVGGADGGEGGAVAGAPTVAGASVEGTVLCHGKAKKIVVFKIRRRKGYRRKQGHRQGWTDVRIDAVHAPTA